ncbi:MAG: hypothetical protein AAFR76_02045 [Planctomycetota bacterium]
MSIGMLAVTASASNREMQEINLERRRAMLLAESGIHIALQVIEQDDAWRTLPSGRVAGTLTLERGELWVNATDADGDLVDDDMDPFTLTSTATFGSAKQRVAVDLEYSFAPVEAVYYPFPNVADGAGQLCVYTYNSLLPICAGGFLQSPIASLYSDITTSWIDKPDPGLIQYYQSRGTVIPQSLSQSGAGRKYSDINITPTQLDMNIEPNPQHIYVLDGNGGDVELESSRLVGTLVVINARSFELDRPRVVRPGPEGLPVIIADCDVFINDADRDRIEETWPDTDDLPEGPDFDEPNFDGIQGIIYADGDIWIDHDLQMRGSVIVTGRADIDDNVTIRHDSAYVDSPPPGFRVTDSLQLVQGSWRTVVD